RWTGVGGTDKIGAYMPVGAKRTYAYLGQEEFTFDNWAAAVRKGNTFMTTGPLLLSAPMVTRPETKSASGQAGEPSKSKLKRGARCLSGGWRSSGTARWWRRKRRRPRRAT